MTWLTDYKMDIARCQKHGESALRAILRNQGLWALLHYRLAHAVDGSSLPGVVKRPLLSCAGASRKVVELATQAQLPFTSTIGSGLLLPHLGGVVLNGNSVIGERCTIYRGVTIGVSGSGERRGVPTLGRGVVIYPNSTVVGPIHVGDGAVIAANSLVKTDVPAGWVAQGVPATARPAGAPSG